MVALKWLLIALLLGYCGLCLLLVVTQRSLMYFPDRTRTAPEAAGLPQAQEVVLNTADGESVLAWFVPAREAKPVVLYFHGNGGALPHRVDRFQRLTADGTGLLAVSYRGYGGSSGTPSQRGLLQDAAAAYAFAAERYPADRIGAWGESLGSGVAVALAAEKPLAALILEAPFTSAAEIAATVYPYIPVRFLMWDQFRSDERIAAVRAPLLILHGERDRTVPIRYGERLFSLANEPKRMVRFPEGGHNGLDQYGALKAVQQFLAGTAKQHAVSDGVRSVSPL